MSKDLKEPKEPFPFFYNPTLSLTSVILLKEVPPTSDLQCLFKKAPTFLHSTFVVNDALSGWAFLALTAKALVVKNEKKKVGHSNFQDCSKPLNHLRPNVKGKERPFGMGNECIPSNFRCIIQNTELYF